MNKQFVVNFMTANGCRDYRYVEAINQRQAIAKVKRELPMEYIITSYEELPRSFVSE